MANKKNALLFRDGLAFCVRVIDRRKLFGREEYLIEPVGGKGQRWVTNLTFISK